MGRKGGAKRLPNSTSGTHAAVSLREEATGKVQMKASSNIKSMLKLDHLKRLALWASCEASIASLGAFYGQHLANVGEATGIPPDPSLTSCQRCESVLHPGFNCTVRIEKNRAKARCRNKKSVTPTQNNLVYKCHFCSHNNLKRGTLKAHMKGICPSKEKSSLEIKPTMTDESATFKQGTINKDETKEKDWFAVRDAARDISMTDSPATPSVRSSTASLEGKNRKRNKKAIEPGSMSAQADAGMIIGTSSKRRRKSWTSLKEIAKSSEQDKSPVANLTIPFLL